MPSYLKLLGSFEAFVGDRPVATRVNAAATLLCYLACHDGWLSRERLCALLWPDAEPQRARLNLRQTLHRARRLPWADALETTSTHVRFPVASDLRAFRTAVDAEDWEAAVDHYRGPLLEGVPMADVAALENWRSAAQQSLHGLWTEALERRAAALADARRHGDAARLLARGLERDPLAENLLAAYMTHSYAGGQRDRALDAYAAFRETLRAELDLDPLDETARLADAIANGALPPGAASGDPIGATVDRSAHPNPPQEPAPTARPELPAPATPFVGRSAELAALRRILEGPDGRLVTITGIGGVGKSRLALELARTAAESFDDGSAFAALADVESAAAPFAIAAALGARLHPSAPPEAQLHALVRQRRLLLVLDNFEHLLESAGLVADLLAAAPDLRIAVTSREPLRLAAERRFPLGGLVYPDPDPTPDAAPTAGASDASSDAASGAFAETAAAELFVRSARRVDTRFVLDAATRASVHRICRRLEGVPLALELAAAWTPLLSPREIADELDASFDLLRVGATDAPARHASLGAVFDSSWELLDERARTTLARLAVFRGGFTKLAAERVADARATDLLGLQRTSLLRRTAQGRFDLHPLVAGFAAAKLAADAELAERTAVAHAEHYLAYLEERGGALRSARQAAALADLRAEWANVRAAWSAAVARRRTDLLTAAHEGCGRFLVLTNNAPDGSAMFAELAEAYREDAYRGEDDELVATAEARRSGFRILLGELDAAEGTLRRCLAADPAPAERVFVLRQLAGLAHQRGEHAESGALLAEALELCERHPGLPGHVEVLSSLGVHGWAIGEYERATAHTEACIALATRTGDYEYRARALAFLGMIANADGRFDDAREVLGRAIPLLDEIDHRVQYAFARSALGYALWKLDDYGAALPPIREAYGLFRELGHAFYSAITAYAMGETLRVLEGPDRAVPYFREALEIALEHDIPNYMLITLFGFAELAKARDPDEAAALLLFVRDHPATWKMDREEADQKLTALGVDAERRASLAERIRDWELEAVVARLLRA